MSTSVKNKKIAMIKIAQNQLNIDDETYRAILNRLTGKTSCKYMNFLELNRVLDEMIKKGFVVKPKNPTHSTPIKTAKYITSDERDKVLSLWIALADIGAVRNRSDQALAAYCKKLTVKAHWHFSDDYIPVIEGLKGWYWREALKILASKLSLTEQHVMSYASPVKTERLTSKVKEATKTSQFSAALAMNTFYYIAECHHIDDPVDFIKLQEVQDATKTA